MIVKGTSKIRNLLDVGSIGLQFKKDSVFTISTEKFWDANLQSAIRMGFVVVEKEKTDSKELSSKTFRCVNKSKNELTLAVLKNTLVKPGHSFTLSEIDINDSNVRAAITSGRIEVVEVIGQDKKKEEGTLKLTDLFNSKPKPQDDDEDDEDDGSGSVEAEISTPPIPPPSKVRLETNEELPALNRVIGEDTAETVTPQPEKIVWNPKTKPVTQSKTRTRATKPKESKAKESKSEEPPQNRIVEGQISSDNKILHVEATPTKTEQDPRTCSLIVDPNHEPITNTIKNATVWTKSGTQKLADEIAFVDQVETANRIKKHPILGKKPVSKPIENDPMIPDQNSV